MTRDTNIESLLKEHSFEEVESVRDNLASEIGKKTELLKSIVKEKYRDIVEASDAIHSMKLNLKQVEKSLWSLDKNITEFYSRVKEPSTISVKNIPIQSENTQPENSSQNLPKANTQADDVVIKSLFGHITSIWEKFDSGDLKEGIFHLNKSQYIINRIKSDKSIDNTVDFKNLEMSVNRATEMIENSLWLRIQSAAPDQIGIICGSDQKDLYQLSLKSSIGFLVSKLIKDISDMSYHAQIKRYQPYTYFNSKTSEVEPDNLSVEASATSLIQLPRSISPELDAYLYGVCKVVNTIAGFDLNRSSIVESLEITITQILTAYSQAAPLVSKLQGETKRKRALQLYFDLLYVRILLSTSICIDLIEKMEPKLIIISNQFELMLDSIELYMISAALHSNVVKASKSTLRLYGLLIPHLQ